MSELILLIIAWAVYFFGHSVLASLQVKKVAQNVLGEQFKYYRIIYVFVSTVGLMGLMLFNASIDSSDLIERSGVVRYISLAMAALGVIILKVAFRSYRLSSFLGVSQEDENAFTTSGILGSIRHPIYSATILLVIGFWLFSPNLPTLVSMVCILVYLPIGMWLEERKLIKNFGDKYLEYKRRVPALVPKFW